MHILTPTRTRIQQFLPGQSRLRKLYNGFGNGSAMRRASVAFETIEEVRTWSKRSSEITHSHFEGIRGAQATLHAGVPTRIDKTDHRVLVRASPIRTRTSLRFSRLSASGAIHVGEAPRRVAHLLLHTKLLSGKFRPAFHREPHTGIALTSDYRMRRKTGNPPREF
jgi:hypothetical protein